jgi:hypothetical protein
VLSYARSQWWWWVDNYGPGHKDNKIGYEGGEWIVHWVTEIVERNA